MKSPVLAAWIAAGLTLAASGARAEPADCDIVCRLQGYLSTDHMAAAPDGAASPSSAAPVKHHAHTARATPKGSATSPQPAARAAPEVAEHQAKPPLKTAAAAPAAPKTRPAVRAAAEADTTKAAASAPAKAARAPKIAAIPPAAPPEAPEAAKPPKHRLVASTVPTAPTADPPASPVIVAAPVRPRHTAHAVPRFLRPVAPHPVESADLIPGSARLMPAEFQPFGNL